MKMLKRPLLAKFYGRNLLLGGSSEGARVLHHFKLLSLINNNNNSFRHFSIGSRNLQQENSSSQKPSIEKTLEQDFPSLKKSSSNAASTQAGKPKTVSSFFKSPFIKTQDERNQYLGTFREIISVSLKEIPNSVVAIATILFLPLAFGTTSFYFSSLPASVLLEYQLNYASMLLILFGSTHLGLEFANFVNKEKFRSFLEAQKSVSPFTPSKQQENIVPVDVEKELEARKTSHSVVRGVLCSLPPMIGFLCLSLPVLQSTLLLSLTFIVLSYYDAYLTARGLAPQWFTSLKIPFTIIIVATLFVSFFFYIVYGAMQQFEKSTEQELAQFEKKSRARSREGIDFLAVAEAKKNRLKTLSTQSPDKPESE